MPVAPGGSGSATILVASHVVLSEGTESFLRAAGLPVYSNTYGTRMLRGGSLVGLGLYLEQDNYTDIQSFTLNFKVNGTTVHTLTVTMTAASTDFHGFNTQSPGIDTFAAGALLEMSVSSIGVVGTTGVPTATAELELEAL